MGNKIVRRGGLFCKVFIKLILV
ncbi:MAG: hypothetical protein US06_C0023G0010, partial [Parcubacteria group bacterium GW2011_GWC2_36_17]